MRQSGLAPGVVGDLQHAWNVLWATAVDVAALLVDITTAALSSSDSSSGSNEGARNPSMVFVVIVGWTTLAFALLYALIMPVVFLVLQFLLLGEQGEDEKERERSCIMHIEND